MANTVQETATLVRLTAKLWSGIKVDERLTDNLASAHGVTNQEAIKFLRKYWVKIATSISEES